MAAIDASVGFGPQAVAMEEGHAVALPQRHRRHFEPGDAGGPENIAVKRSVLSVLRERRHDIGEGPERTACPAHDATRKSFRRKAAARGFQQRQASFQRQGEGTAAPLDPLDALAHRRSGLDDAPHRQLVDFAVTSSRPRASSSSRTSRFGTLPYPDFGNASQKKNRFGIL
jgi:hypothetical protein